MSSEGAKPEARKRPVSQQLHLTLRWLHTYLSVFTFLVVLFFSITGVTLNHPEWTFGESRKSVKGTLPEAAMKKDGEVDWLIVVENLRKKHGLRGEAKDMRADSGQGSLAFKSPGMVADCYFDLATREYEITVTAQDGIGVINDLHRGRDAGQIWSWLIDLSGILLTLVSATGLGILFYLKKSRTAGFIVVGIGAVVLILAIMIALK